MLSIDSVLRGLFFPNQICNLFCQHSSAEVIQRACCPYLVRKVVFSKLTACIHFRSKTVIEMPPKKSHKVKGFKLDWTKEFVDGYCVGSWVTSDPTSTMKARCLLCPPKIGESLRTFSIAEGFSAISRHSKTSSHQRLFMQSMEDPNRTIPARQLSIKQAVRNQEEISEADRKRSRQLQIS